MLILLFVHALRVPNRHDLYKYDIGYISVQCHVYCWVTTVIYSMLDIICNHAIGAFMLGGLVLAG